MRKRIPLSCIITCHNNSKIMERVGEKAAARQQLTCCRAIPSSFTARCGGADGTLTVLANGSPFLYLLGSGSRVSRTVPQSLCDLRTATIYRVMWQCYFLEFFHVYFYYGM